MKPQPLNLFQDTAADLPLFSGTPIKAHEESFRPEEEARPVPMFATACPVCYGTRQVKKGKKIIPCMYCK